MKKPAPEVNKNDLIPLHHHSVRVDVEKLDRLLGLVDALAASETLLTQNPGQSPDRFEKSLRHLAKITRELQDVVVSIRMAPVSEIFGRLSRMVCDLSLKTGKRIELQLTGREVAMERTVLAAVTNSLIHIVRNCIDHGIEMPGEREGVGKTTDAHITLDVRSDADDISITVSDDGKGLNRQKILQMAREKDLIEGDGSEMKDGEVWMLLLQPGFSTAEKITELSGRGLGMDIVRREMEAIHGEVRIESEDGKGTTVTLSIPKNRHDYSPPDRHISPCNIARQK
jgi:two-component system chemotaxis sensor kinase CheA